MTLYHTGCAVWGHKGWAGVFYPKRYKPSDALALYGARLTAVELNTTFYAAPPDDVLDRWASETPETFRFCPKLPRTVTHNGPLAPRAGEGVHFARRCRRLGPRLGPVFGLMPASYGPDREDDLVRFLDAWTREVGHQSAEEPIELALEPRCPAWFEPERSHRFNALLRERGISRVMLDTRPVYQGPGDPQRESQRKKPDLPVSVAVTADFVMVRYIGHPELPVNGRYLGQWAPRIAQWLESGTRVYFFSHCPDETHSPAIVRRFHAAMAERGAPVRPLPWNDVKDEPDQLALV